MTHRERLEAKAERRRGWAESREAKAEAAFDRAAEVADGIPLGQPILVGHHSEGRARRDQERIERGMIAGHENAKKAVEHERAADGIDRQLANSVFSDDEDAPKRLREQIADLEAARDRIKAYNASCRKGARDVTLLDERQQAELVTTARVAAFQIGKNGEFPAYVLTNLGGRIRDKKKRAERIADERAQADEGGRGTAKPMLARYGGTCGACGQPFLRGAAILWYRTTREAVHPTCQEATR